MSDDLSESDKVACPQCDASGSVDYGDWFGGRQCAFCGGVGKMDRALIQSIFVQSISRDREYRDACLRAIAVAVALLPIGLLLAKFVGTLFALVFFIAGGVYGFMFYSSLWGKVYYNGSDWLPSASQVRKLAMSAGFLLE